MLGEENGLLVLVDQHAAHERVRLEHLQSGTVCTAAIMLIISKQVVTHARHSPPVIICLSVSCNT